MAFKVMLLCNICEYGNLIVITKQNIQTPIILVHDVYCKTLKTGMDGCIYDIRIV